MSDALYACIDGQCLSKNYHKFVCFLCRTAWVQKIKAASELYIETEKKKREKAYLGNKLNHYTHLAKAQPWPTAKYRVKIHRYIGTVHVPDKNSLKQRTCSYDFYHCAR